MVRASHRSGLCYTDRGAYGDDNVSFTASPLLPKEVLWVLCAYKKGRGRQNVDHKALPGLEAAYIDRHRMFPRFSCLSPETPRPPTRSFPAAGELCPACPTSYAPAGVVTLLAFLRQGREIFGAKYGEAASGARDGRGKWPQNRPQTRPNLRGERDSRKYIGRLCIPAKGQKRPFQQKGDTSRQFVWAKPVATSRNSAAS